MRGLWGNIWVRGLVTAIAAVILYPVINALIFFAVMLPWIARMYSVGFATYTNVQWTSVAPVLAVSPLWLAAELYVKRTRHVPPIRTWMGFLIVFVVLGCLFQLAGQVVGVPFLARSLPDYLAIAGTWMLANLVVGLLAFLRFKPIVRRPR